MIRECIEHNTVFGIVGNEFIKDETISNEIVSIYAIIRTILFDISKNCSVMNMQTLYDLVGADTKNGSKVTKPVKEAIEWLVENEYIAIYDMLYKPIQFNSKSQAMFRISFLMEDEYNKFDADGGFTKVPESNICKLLSYINANKGIKKYSFIRYYLVIARQCSNDQNFGYISMKKLGEIVGISETTCTDWNNVLKKLEVIDFNNEYGHIRNEKFKMDCTMFGHYNVVNQEGLELTTELFDDCVANRVKNTKLMKVDKEAIASKKSIASKKVWDERKAMNNICDVTEEKATAIKPKEPINFEDVVKNINKPKTGQLHTVEFVKNYCHDVIEDIKKCKYTFTEDRFVNEIVRVACNVPFSKMNIGDANNLYKHMVMWVIANDKSDVLDDEVLPY